MKYGSYKIIPDKKLVIEYYSGELDYDDLIEFKKAIIKEPEYDFYFQTIVDLRYCFLKTNPQDFVNWIDFINTNFGNERVRKVAYLTSKPNEVVLTTLFLHQHKQFVKSLSANVFSTIEGVVSWFGHDVISIKELDNILEELKNSNKNVFNE